MEMKLSARSVNHTSDNNLIEINESKISLVLDAGNTNIITLPIPKTYLEIEFSSLS